MPPPRRSRRAQLVQLDQRSIIRKVIDSLGDLARDIEIVKHCSENLDVQTCAIFGDAPVDELLRAAVAIQAGVLQIHASTSAMMATAGELITVADLYRMIEAAGPIELVVEVVQSDRPVKEDYEGQGKEEEPDPEDVQ